MSLSLGESPTNSPLSPSLSLSAVRVRFCGSLYELLEMSPPSRTLVLTALAISVYELGLAGAAARGIPFLPFNNFLNFTISRVANTERLNNK